jgi:hypothetical protein
MSIVQSSLLRKQFDAYRQGVWDQFAPLHDQTYAAINNGTITFEQMSLAVSRLTNLLTAYQNYYASIRDQAGADYVDSRFHDFYDPMMKVLQDWNSKLYQLQPAMSVTSSGLPTTSIPVSSFAPFMPAPAGPSGPLGPSAYGAEEMPEWMKTETTAPTGETPSTLKTYLPWIVGAGLVLLFLRKR